MYIASLRQGAAAAHSAVRCMLLLGGLRSTRKHHPEDNVLLSDDSRSPQSALNDGESKGRRDSYTIDDLEQPPAASDGNEGGLRLQ